MKQLLLGMILAAPALLALYAAARAARRLLMPEAAGVVAAIGVLLEDLMRDAHEGAAHVVAVEDDLGVLQRDPSWPRGTGLKEPTRPP